MKTVIVIRSKSHSRTHVVDYLKDKGFDIVREVSLDQFFTQADMILADGIVVDEGESFNVFLRVFEHVSAHHPVPVVYLYSSVEGGGDEGCVKGVMMTPFCDVRFASLFREALFQMRDFCEICVENEDLKKEKNDRKVIERAKWILVQKEGLSEDMAFKRIRSVSMAARKSMKDVALEILSVAGGPYQDE